MYEEWLSWYYKNEQGKLRYGIEIRLDLLIWKYVRRAYTLRAHQNVIPTISTFAVAVSSMTPLTPFLPQEGETVPIPPPTQARRRTAPDRQETLTVPKRRKWTAKQMEVLCFCAQYLS